MYGSLATYLLYGEEVFNGYEIPVLLYLLALKLKECL